MQIGLLASDGIVIAADREEGDGYLKNDTGKIATSYKGLEPIGVMAVTGAGTGLYIDEVSDILRATFCANQEGTTNS